MSVLWLDLRASVRAGRRNWAPTVFGVIALSAGAAIVSVLLTPIDVMLLRPLPFGDPDRVFLLAGVSKAASARPISVSPDDLARFRSRTDLFESVSGFAPGAAFDDSPVEAAQEGVKGTDVDADFTTALGVSPIVGRPLMLSDGEAIHPVALVSARLWRSRFGDIPTHLDREIIVGGRRLIVVGLMSDDFDFPNGSNVWTLRQDDPGWRQFQHLQSVIRLRPGVSAAAAAHGVGAADSQQGDERPFLWPIRSALIPDEFSTLFMFAGAAVVTFLIGWIQLAGLQLGRLVGNLRELSIRFALGASRRQVQRICVLDGVLLAVLSAVFATLLIAPFFQVFRVLIPAEFTGDRVLGLGLINFASVWGLCLMGGGLFAWIASTAVTRYHGFELKAPTTVSTGERRFRSVISVVQLTVTGVLLYVAILLTISYFKISRQDLHFSPANLYVVSPQVDFDDRAQLKRRLSSLEQEIRTISGVQSVALTDADPMGSGGLYRSVRAGAGSHQVRWRVVGPTYLQTLQTVMIEGRWFDPTRDRSIPVAVVNETFARRAFSNRDPNPRYLHDSLRRFQVVGIVRDMRNVTASSAPEPEVYTLASASIFFAANLVVRTDPRVDSAIVMSQIRRAAKSVFPGSSEPRLKSVTDILALQQAPIRTRSQLLLAFTFAALLLSFLGVYSAVGHMVGQRWKEFAIRSSLGASPVLLVRHVLWTGLKPGLLSAILASTVGFWMATGLRAYIFGIEPTSLSLPVSVCFVLIATVLVAGMLPARRAGLISPSESLRE